MYAALPVKTLDGGFHLTVRQLLDGSFQLRVALAHDLLQPRRPHSRFLKLRKGAACFDGFMLARIAYQKNAVITDPALNNATICGEFHPMKHGAN
jgi:hypothetical protein